MSVFAFSQRIILYSIGSDGNNLAHLELRKLKLIVCFESWLQPNEERTLALVTKGLIALYS